MLKRNYHVKYFREHYELSNGQHMGIYFKRVKVNYHFSLSSYTYWLVGLVIADTKRQCNDWYEDKRNKRRRKINYKSTGKVGLEGLRIAFNSIKRLTENIACNEVIYIEWADEKRKKAYKYLERIGFVDFGNKLRYYRRNY